jgi:hypothetical protein
VRDGHRYGAGRGSRGGRHDGGGPRPRATSRRGGSRAVLACAVLGAVVAAFTACSGDDTDAGAGGAGSDAEIEAVVDDERSVLSVEAGDG